MFTGLVQGVGHLAARTARGGDARLRIAIGTLPLADAQPCVAATQFACSEAADALDESGEHRSCLSAAAAWPRRSSCPGS